MTIFEFTGTANQQRVARAGIDRCDFPFERLEQSLRAEGRQRVRIDWQDLSRYGQQAAQTKTSTIPARAHEGIHEGDAVAHPIEREVDGRKRVLGLFYLPPYTRIVLDASLERSPELAAEVALAEAAHLVDYHYMSRDERRQITNYLHRDDLPEGHSTDDGVAFQLDGHRCSWFDVGPYEWWVGEAFMESFCEAFSDVRVTIALRHPTSPAVARQIRSLLMREPAEPEPTPEPTRRVFVSRRGKKYHDSHAKITIQGYMTRSDAEAAGYKPCRVCKPVG